MKLHSSMPIALALATAAWSCGPADSKRVDPGAAQASAGAVYRGQAAGGRFMIEVRPDSGAIPLNEPFELLVRVEDEQQQGAETLTLDVDGFMPGHGHGMLRNSEVAREADGSYRVRGMLFHMGGEWELRVRVAWREERGEHFSIRSDEIAFPVVL